MGNKSKTEKKPLASEKVNVSAKRSQHTERDTIQDRHSPRTSNEASGAVPVHHDVGRRHDSSWTISTRSELVPLSPPSYPRDARDLLDPAPAEETTLPSERLEHSLAERSYPRLPSQQHATATGDQRQQQQAGHAPYGLSGLSAQFAAIGLGNHTACRAFIHSHPPFLSVSSDDFLTEAVAAMRYDDIIYSRQCVQRAVVLKRCQEMTSSGRRDYLRALEDGTTVIIRSFLEDFDRVRTSVSNRVHTERRSQDIQQASVRTENRPTRTVSYTNPRALPPIAEQLPYQHSPRAYPVDVRYSDQGGGFDTAHDDPQTLQQISSYGQAQTGSETEEQRRQMQRHQGIGRDSHNYQQSEGQSAENYSVDIRNLDIKDKEGAPLDARFSEQYPGVSFFTVGRVFAMLYHENAGNSRLAEDEMRKREERYGPALRNPQQAVVYTKGPYGEWIYSHIRRMAVVKARRVYCWCIPINTYGQHGVARRRFSQQELEAHTIIHNSNVSPYKSKEEKGMIKKPIAVDLAPHQKLNDMSRLNFSKVYTIDHNVKVMNVGMVARSSMADFEGYWSAEVATKSGHSR